MYLAPSFLKSSAYSDFLTTLITSIPFDVKYLYIYFPNELYATSFKTALGLCSIAASYM